MKKAILINGDDFSRSDDGIVHVVINKLKIQEMVGRQDKTNASKCQEAKANHYENDISPSQKIIDQQNQC